MSKVVVSGLPAWFPHRRLLGGDDWESVEGGWVAERSREEAADLSARLRGLHLGGQPTEVRVFPRLKRAVVRAARTEDARRRRVTTPGFVRSRVRVDGEARRYLTPEKLAYALGKRVSGWKVLDGCCGAGGNAIGFARAGCTVIAVEPDPRRAEDARHNARVYGVADRVQVKTGKVQSYLNTKVDLIFLDPPWGDVPKEGCSISHLGFMGEVLSRLPAGVEVWWKLPPNFRTWELEGYEPEAWFGHGKGDSRRVKFLLLKRLVGT